MRRIGTETIRAYFDDDMVCFCKPGDERDLADSISKLYHDSDRRAQQVSSSSRFNAAYNWDEQRKSYFEMVDSLVATARH